MPIEPQSPLVKNKINKSHKFNGFVMEVEFCKICMYAYIYACQVLIGLHNKDKTKIHGLLQIRSLEVKHTLAYYH